MSSYTDFKDAGLPNGRYTMMVDRVHNNRRSFNSKDGTKYVHDIYFVDENKGISYRGELVTVHVDQADFEGGKEYCFEVVNQSMREINKCGNGRYEPSYVESSSRKRQEMDAHDDVFSPNVSGKSYTYAMGFAKDIAVARIRGGHITGDEEDFMDDLKRMAWDMHQWMMDPKPAKEKLPF